MPAWRTSRNGAAVWMTATSISSASVCEHLKSVNFATERWSSPGSELQECLCQEQLGCWILRRWHGPVTCCGEIDLPINDLDDRVHIYYSLITTVIHCHVRQALLLETVRPKLAAAKPNKFDKISKIFVEGQSDGISDVPYCTCLGLSYWLECKNLCRVSHIYSNLVCHTSQIIEIGSINLERIQGYSQI